MHIPHILSACITDISSPVHHLDLIEGTTCQNLPRFVNTFNINSSGK